MDRPGGKRGSRKRNERDGGRPGRRTPPPPATGLENRYFEGVKSSGTLLVLTMTDGQTVSGPVEAFDRELITIGGERGSRVVRKSDIRYISEES